MHDMLKAVLKLPLNAESGTLIKKHENAGKKIDHTKNPKANGMEVPKNH